MPIPSAPVSTLPSTSSRCWRFRAFPVRSPWGDPTGATCAEPGPGPANATAVTAADHRERAHPGGQRRTAVAYAFGRLRRNVVGIEPQQRFGECQPAKFVHDLLVVHYLLLSAGSTSAPTRGRARARGGRPRRAR